MSYMTNSSLCDLWENGPTRPLVSQFTMIQNVANKENKSEQKQTKECV